ncbi:hypothetical protein VZQ01_06640 [Myxococcus faecalis]|uniref:hypothetical protein n=1 Tax=Myxococcus TaxID=32 RepID=UPI002D1E41D4|nr:hypothetical protein [Myxococcus sp. MISCRS1]
MTTVNRRTFRSVPHRDAVRTWTDIVELLTQGKAGADRDELLAVTGVVSCLITDQSPKEAPIVVTCDGPRTRIYCIYDEDAVDGTDASEDVLGYDPLEGQWSVSLPCGTDDLAWVQSTLSTHGSRVTARDVSSGISIDDDETRLSKAGPLILDPKGFLES